jgi:hypothetical protein
MGRRLVASERAVGQDPHLFGRKEEEEVVAN